MGQYAWVTLATNDSYAIGALVLAHSLRRVGTNHQLAVIVIPGISSSMRKQLEEVFDVIKEVDALDSHDAVNLKLLNRPELGITFTKLNCWRLTQFEKCVFLDADTLVLQNVDELFQREELSAAPDVGWPDCFNSGVFVYKPSEKTFQDLLHFANAKGSFDGGDQGLLNLYFHNWAHEDIKKHLPFIYNMCSTACYSYLPAYKEFAQNVKIIHFIGNTKPWLQKYDFATRQMHLGGEVYHLEPFMRLWWDIFCFSVYPTLTTQMAGLAGAFARLEVNAEAVTQQQEIEDHFRKGRWEEGNIDYMNRDSFNNIWSKISETIQPRASPERSLDQTVTRRKSIDTEDTKSAQSQPEPDTTESEQTEREDTSNLSTQKRTESPTKVAPSTTTTTTKAEEVLATCSRSVPKAPVATIASDKPASPSCPKASPGIVKELESDSSCPKLSGAETTSSIQCTKNDQSKKAGESTVVIAPSDQPHKSLKEVDTTSISKPTQLSQKEAIPIDSGAKVVPPLSKQIPTSTVAHDLGTETQSPALLKTAANVEEPKKTLPPKEIITAAVPAPTAPIPTKEVTPESSKKLPEVQDPISNKNKTQPDVPIDTQALATSETTTASSQSASAPVAPPRKATGTGADKKKVVKGKK